MKWQTGIVMEIQDRNGILLTQNGEFVKVKLRGEIPDIGDEVRVPVANNFNLNVPFKKWVAVAAAILMFAIGSPLLSMFTRAPEVAMAYVSIDINPSVELTVGNYNHVLAVQSYNNDGEKVLNGLDLNGLDVKEAVEAISKKAKDLGFIKKSNNHSIILSVAYVPGVDKSKSVNETTLLALANEALGETLGVNETKDTVQTIKLSSDLRNAAKKKGLSPGKYAVLIEAVNAGLPLTEKDIKDKSIEVAIASVGGEPDKIINQAHQEKSFDQKEQRYYAILGARNRNVDDSEEDIPVKTTASDVTKANNERNDSGKSNDRKTEEGKASSSTANQTTPAKNDNDGNTGKSGGTEGTTNPTPVVTGDDGNSTRTNDTSRQDDTTSEDYMGNDSSDQSTNDSMNKLKPNF